MDSTQAKTQAPLRPHGESGTNKQLDGCNFIAVIKEPLRVKSQVHVHGLPSAFNLSSALCHATMAWQILMSMRSSPQPDLFLNNLAHSAFGVDIVILVVRTVHLKISQGSTMSMGQTPNFAMDSG
jgi:hypothetical protein